MLEITKEKVLEAAGKCSEAREVLETLFPEIFRDSEYFDLSKLKACNSGESTVISGCIFSQNSSTEAGFRNLEFLQITKFGRYKHKGFYLSSEYEWKIVKDEANCLILLPTKNIKKK